MSVTTENQEILKMLNGCEVMSWEHEGTVLIKGDKGFVNGEQFDIKDEDIETLWEAYKEQEGF